MATAGEKLHILVIQHLEHVGVGDDVVAPLKAALENGKTAEGSTLYELFCSATGEGRPPQKQQQQQQAQKGRTSMTGQQAAPVQQPIPAGRMSAQIQQQVIVPETKPVIAKEPEVRSSNLDAQLMAAAKSGSADAIPGYVSRGAYVNFQDGAGTSPLLAATEADKIEVVKVLLENGADVNLARPDGTSPLLCAYKGNKKKLLKELTAGAFRTLNSAVHNTGNIGGNLMHMPETDEGVTDMDMCQLRDETNKLFGLAAHPQEAPQPISVAARKESLVQIGGPMDMSDLRQGGVRLLMQELVNTTHHRA